MSTATGKGSSGKSDDVLMAILKHLNAMDGKLQIMDKRLLAMEKIRAKVSALEASTADMGAQQDTLAAAVKRVDLAHLELNDKVARVETSHHNPPPHSRQPIGGGRRHRRRLRIDDAQAGVSQVRRHRRPLALAESV
jgi:hypothetical protein